MEVLGHEDFPQGTVTVYQDSITFPSCNWTYRDSMNRYDVIIMDNEPNIVKINIRHPHPRRGPVREIIFDNVNDNHKFVAVLYERLENNPEHSRRFEAYKIYRKDSESEIRLISTSGIARRIETDKPGIIRYYCCSGRAIRDNLTEADMDYSYQTDGDSGHSFSTLLEM